MEKGNGDGGGGRGGREGREGKGKERDGEGKGNEKGKGKAKVHWSIYSIPLCKSRLCRQLSCTLLLFSQAHSRKHYHRLQH